MRKRYKDHFRKDHILSLLTETSEVNICKMKRLTIDEEVNTDHMNELTSIRSRTNPVREDDTESCFIECEVGAADTLQSLSLKYGCKVADLKSANNLIQDQDVFALKSVRIPVRRHGLLLELFGKQVQETVLNGIDANSQHTSLSNSPANSNDALDHVQWAANLIEEEEDSEDSADDTRPLVQHVQTVSINSNFQSQSKQAARFLQNMDKDIRDILTNTKRKARRTSDTHRHRYLQQTRFQPAKSKSNTHDYGIRWWTLLILMLVVALVTPTVYILYFDVYKKSSQTATVNGTATSQ